MPIHELEEKVNTPEDTIHRGSDMANVPDLDGTSVDDESGEGLRKAKPPLDNDLVDMREDKEFITSLDALIANVNNNLVNNDLVKEEVARFAKKDRDWIVKKAEASGLRMIKAANASVSGGTTCGHNNVHKMVKSLRGNKIIKTLNSSNTGTNNRIHSNIRSSNYDTSTNSLFETPVPTVQLPTPSPPKPSLTELVAGLMSDIVNGKIADVDQLVQILQCTTNYEPKRATSNAHTVVMLNFDDDTSRAVIQLNDKEMDIVMNWYGETNTFVDVEETNHKIPAWVDSTSGLDAFLYRDISFKFKDRFVKEYLPLAINDLLTKQKLFDAGQNLFLKEKPVTKHKYEESSSQPVINKPKYDAAQQAGFQFWRDASTSLSESDKLQALMRQPPSIEGLCNPNTHHSNGSIARAYRNGKETSTKVSTILGADVHSLRKNRLFEEFGIKVPESLKSDTANVVSTGNTSTVPYDMSDGDAFDPNDTAPKAYNQDYNVLCPAFGSNCALLEEINEPVRKEHAKEDTLVVILNEKTFTTLVLTNPTHVELNVLENCPEYGFVTLFKYKTSEKDMLAVIATEFHVASFNDIEELNKKMFIVAQHIDYSNKRHAVELEVATEEGQVKSLLKCNFVITENPEQKMKASVLYDIILNSPFVNVEHSKLAGFKTRLAKYLKDAGLQKKRYNDGFYYYGIVLVDKPPQFLSKLSQKTGDYVNTPWPTY